jgi:signal transduction histidine kinase
MNTEIKLNRPLLLVSVIAIIAILLAFTSSQFFNDASNKIIEIAAGEDRASARILAHDLADSLADKLEGIQQKVQIIAQTPSVQEKSVEKVGTLLEITQQTSGDMTDFYGWVDKDGRVVRTSIIANENPDYARFVGVDKSNQDWFINAKETKNGYVSTAEKSSDDGIERIFISYPILDGRSGGFGGVIYAGVPLAKINNYVGNQVYSRRGITTDLLDMNGTVLQTKNTNLLGMNYFSKEYQDVVATMNEDEGLDKKAYDDDGSNGGLQEFTRNAFDNTSSSSPSSSLPGSGVTAAADFTDGNQTVSVAYSYVKLGGTNFAVVFTKVSHAIAPDVETFIDQQRFASVARIVVVGAAAVSIGVWVLLWNRKLERTVADRTQALASKTDELLTANEQLKQHDRLQKEFVNIAAHELRTPITPILASIDTVKSIMDSNGEKMVMLSEGYYDIILRNIKRLERLSSDILQAARIESGTFSLHKEKFDLDRLVSNIVVDTSESMPRSKKGMQIVFEPNHDGGPIVEADQSKLYQVMTNLMQNAVRFTTAEGKIVISTEKRAIAKEGGEEETEVVVKVKDTGSGIAQDILPRLFQKFASASSRDNLGGTGLGLYVSKVIVEAHGGKIWAENNADGKGATFSFSIPMQNSSNSNSLQKI